MTGQSIPQDMSTEGVPEVEQEPKHDHIFGVYCHVACPRWGNPEPQPGWETPQDWLFTFGADHTHPDSGERLGRKFVRIHGTCDSTRNDMFAVFGNRWSHQYSSEEKAGVEEYGLTEVPMPQSFAVQLDTHLKRLAAERTPSVAAVEERTEENTQRCPNCAPGYDCERGIYTPVAPAEECTGVSDVKAEVLEEVEALRREIEIGWWEVDEPGREQALARLDRIEAAVQRGEQR